MDFFGIFFFHSPQINVPLTLPFGMYSEKLDMLLDALKEENMLGSANGEATRTLNDMTQLNNSFGEIVKVAVEAEAVETPPPTVTERRLSFSFKGSNVKTEKDKFNTKERRNSKYYVRNADKEAIQTRANSLKLAINTVMEHSGLYDHKPRHGARKHSLAALNIPANLSSTNEQSQTTPPPSIIEPSSSSTNQNHLTADETNVSNLSPLPDQRRSSMDDYFFNSVSLPVPKQFADAASRRSSGVPEPIKEEEGNGHSMTFNTKDNIETEYNYDVGYLCPSDGSHCESAVPYEVYERNLLRAATMQHSGNHVEKDNHIKSDASNSTIKQITHCAHMLQVPIISMADVDMMERHPATFSAENVYTSESMTIIDTDHVVSFILLASGHFSCCRNLIFKSEFDFLSHDRNGNQFLKKMLLKQVMYCQLSVMKNVVLHRKFSIKVHHAIHRVNRIFMQLKLFR